MRWKFSKKAISYYCLMMCLPPFVLVLVKLPPQKNDNVFRTWQPFENLDRSFLNEFNMLSLLLLFLKLIVSSGQNQSTIATTKREWMEKILAINAWHFPQRSTFMKESATQKGVAMDKIKWKIYADICNLFIIFFGGGWDDLWDIVIQLYSPSVPFVNIIG